MNKITHFGVEFKESKYGYKLSRETYIPDLTPSMQKFYTKNELQQYIRDCYKNYDLNMKFFAKLDSNKFNSQLNNFLANHKEFKQIFNMAETKNKSGYYVMVLDEYKQVYIGTSDSSIYDRLRRHMAQNQGFDRLLWGDWHDSRLSINSFRPLDTTKLFVYFTDESFLNENDYIKCFDDDFVLNRTMGGYLENGFLDAFINSKLRKLK